MTTRWNGVARLVIACLAATVIVACKPKPIDPTAPVHFDPVPIASWTANGEGRTALLVGNTIYVGGDFTTVTSPDGATVIARANLAAFDVTTGALIDTFRADTNGQVRALAFDGTRLFAGGKFTTVNGQTRARLAAVDPATGAVDPDWSISADSHVYALAIGGEKLFVGGAFSTVAGTARTRLASFDLADAMLTPYAPVLDGSVGTLATNSSGTDVYIGGDFTMVDRAPSQWLAHIDAAGALVPTPWERLQGSVTDLDLSVDGTRLAVAQAGGGNQISRYDVTTGERTWRQRCDGDGQAVEIINGSVLGGFHEACDDDTSLRLTSNAAADGTRDQLFMPSFDKYWGIRAIDATATALVVAGDFTQISGVAVQGFAIFGVRPPVVIPP